MKMSDEPKVKLKPCPFCGSDAQLFSEIFIFVCCTHCTVDLGGFENINDAVKKWNTRWLEKNDV